MKEVQKKRQDHYMQKAQTTSKRRNRYFPDLLKSLTCGINEKNGSGIQNQEAPTKRTNKGPNPYGVKGTLMCENCRDMKKKVNPLLTKN